MRIKHTFRLPPALSSQLADYAGRKRISQVLVVEAALASFLSPDASERMEAAISRRLDRHTRQLERLEHHVKISNEAIALFVYPSGSGRLSLFLELKQVSDVVT
jgi:predicted transcriptional regulator